MTTKERKKGRRKGRKEGNSRTHEIKAVNYLQRSYLKSPWKKCQTLKKADPFKREITNEKILAAEIILNIHKTHCELHKINS